MVVSMGQCTGRVYARKETHIKCQRFTAVLNLVPVDADEGLAVLEQTCLQTDHDKLHARRSVVVDIVRNAGNVGVIEGCVDLVEHEEGRRLVRVDSE